jgi:ABC-type antimicrobial peptide transport system permease subunit
MGDPVQPMVYVALDQAEEPQRLLTAAIRTEGEPRSLETAVRAAVQATSPDLVVSYVRTMDEQIDTSLTRERLLATLSIAFGALGLVLAAVGLYGVMAYGVARRLREFGIRVALGATHANVLHQVFRETLVVVAVGLIAGLAAATAATKAVSTFLYDLAPNDPLTFGMAAAVLILASLAAGYFPARRAASADPATALRTE